MQSAAKNRLGRSPSPHPPILRVVDALGTEVGPLGRRRGIPRPLEVRGSEHVGEPQVARLMVVEEEQAVSERGGWVAPRVAAIGHVEYEMGGQRESSKRRAKRQRPAASVGRTPVRGGAPTASQLRRDGRSAHASLVRRTYVCRQERPGPGPRGSDEGTRAGRLPRRPLTFSSRALDARKGASICKSRRRPCAMNAWWGQRCTGRDVAQVE